MKNLFLVILCLVSSAHAISIEAKPVRFNLLVKQSEFKVNFNPSVQLTCEGTKKCLMDCTTAVVRKTLKIKTSVVSETDGIIHYAIEYKGKDVLKNPYSPVKYKDLSCYVQAIIEIEDPLNEGTGAGLDSKFVQAWAIYKGSKFTDLLNLDHTEFKYYYDWEKYPGRSNCSRAPPILCQKFLHIVPTQAPSDLKQDLISSGTYEIFPYP